MILFARMECRVLALAIALFSAAAPAVAGSAGTALPRATPESQGISSAGLQALYAEVDAERFGIHGLMVLRHGKVVAGGQTFYPLLVPCVTSFASVPSLTIPVSSTLVGIPVNTSGVPSNLPSVPVW